jgi:hypothetical protein
MALKFKTGLIKSPKDSRDYLLKTYLPPLTVSLPEEHLLWLKWQTPVKYQADLGSCVSFSSLGAKESYDCKELGVVPNLSEQFHYGKCKETDGMPNEEGTYFRASLEVLLKTGVCEEEYHPYEAKYPPDNPPKSGALENALKYKIQSYAFVGVTKEEIKRAIYQNGPVLLGVMIHDSFVNVGSDGIIQFPSGEVHGGHGIEGVAYNKLGIICKNSWSEFWGEITVDGTKYKGYCIIPWIVWEQINMGEVWSFVDVIALNKPWNDWLDENMELGWQVKNSGIFLGFPDGDFHVYANITQHQAIVVAERLELPVPKLPWGDRRKSWSTEATRGWIHEKWPQYTFLEENWDKPITRFQFASIIGRYLNRE